MGQITVEKNVGGIEGLCIIKPAVHGDSRGYFMETYNSRDMQEAGIDTEFHVYSGLGHGFGLGTGTSAEGWINDAVAFWEKQMKT